MLSKILGTIKSIVSPITDMVDELNTSDEEKLKIKSAITRMENDLRGQIVTEQSKIIIAEVKSQSWLTKNWRPAIMAIFGIIIFNNYVLAPYLSAMFGVQLVLEIPEPMWELLKIGIGGYIVGRTAEKSVDKWKSN